MHNDKTICPLAWLHRFTNVGGEVQVCCSSEEKDNNIRDDDGKLMNISDASDQPLDDEKIMNSKFMKNVRLQMLNGEWPEFCQRCKVTEQTGGKSRRNAELSRYGDSIEELTLQTAQDGTIPVKIRSADYRLGNLCNLACRMCNPRSSSQWIKKWNDVDQDDFSLTPQDVKMFNGYDWYKKPGMLANIRAQAPTLEHLHFAGGEPLIVPEMIEILETCVSLEHASHIRLTYNTNITKIPEKLKSLWPKFNGVYLYCSIDAYGPLNEFIRHPSSWKTIDRNLRDLDKNFKQYGLAEIQVMTTVQAYNVLALEDLYDYLAENMENAKKIPHLIDLYFPDYYRTQVLPKAVKKIAKERLEKVLKKTKQRIEQGVIPENQSYILDSLVSTLNFLGFEDYEMHFGKFIRAARSKDLFLGQDTFKLLPELAEFAKHAKYKITLPSK